MKQKLIMLAVISLLVLGGYFLISRPDTRWEVRNYPASSEGDIIAFGDSLTSGHLVTANESYPSLLSSMIGEKIINEGVVGNTTADGLARLNQDVLDYEPRIVLVGLGGNDMLRKQPVAEAEENLKQIITRIQSTGAMVVVLGIEGTFLFGGDYKGMHQRVAEETGSVYVSNILEDVIGDRSLMADQIHPNGEGYKIVVDKIYKEAGPYLEGTH